MQLSDAALLRNFESIGDNCEFGLVQRAIGIEQLGFFRFNSSPLKSTIRAIDSGFVDFQNDFQLQIETACNNELMAYIPSYDFRYHTFKQDGQVDKTALRRQQQQIIRFLARKTLDDLKTGEKVFIRKDTVGISDDEIGELHRSLKSYGSNTLLWVTTSTHAAQNGTVEHMAPSLLRGYIDTFSSFSDARNFSFQWFQICRQAHTLVHKNTTTSNRPPLEETSTRYKLTSLERLTNTEHLKIIPDGNRKKADHCVRSQLHHLSHLNNACVHGTTGIVTVGQHVISESLTAAGIKLIAGAHLIEPDILELPVRRSQVRIPKAVHLLNHGNTPQDWLAELHTNFCHECYQQRDTQSASIEPNVYLLPDRTDFKILEPIQQLIPPSAPYIALADSSTIQCDSLIYTTPNNVSNTT